VRAGKKRRRDDGQSGSEAEGAETEGSLGLVCLTNEPRFVWNAQGSAARLTNADVHAFDALTKRERCRDTDRTDRDDFAGIGEIGFQDVTTAVSIYGEPRQSQRGAEAEGGKKR